MRSSDETAISPPADPRRGAAAGRKPAPRYVEPRLRRHGDLRSALLGPSPTIGESGNLNTHGE